MADPKTLRLTSQALDHIAGRVDVAKEWLAMAERHASDVQVGRYVIHREENGTLMIMKNEGSWRIVDEDLLASCVGMAYSKITGEE